MVMSYTHAQTLDRRLVVSNEIEDQVETNGATDTTDFVMFLANAVGSVQITLNGPSQTSSLVGSGRVVSKSHYTDPTRPDPRTAWVSDKSADFVWS